jgi:hypothetical protein
MGRLLRWHCSLGVCLLQFERSHIVCRVLTSSSALSTIPALLYTFAERAIGLNTTVLGARYGI